MAHSEEGARVCVQSLGIKPGGPNPEGPALGMPRSCFNVNFNSYAHGLRSGTKVPLALLNEKEIYVFLEDFIHIFPIQGV